MSSHYEKYKHQMKKWQEENKEYLKEYHRKYRERLKLLKQKELEAKVIETYFKSKLDEDVGEGSIMIEGYGDIKWSLLNEKEVSQKIRPHSESLS